MFIVRKSRYPGAGGVSYAEVNIGEERIGELSFSPLSSLITISCGLIPKKEGEE